jgi:hypothetical protein
MLRARSALLGVGLVLAASASAWADAPKVDITSFDYVNNAGRMAELCGKVTGANSVVLARVVVDVNTPNPGIYNVMVGKDGLFCTTVASYRGTANVTVEYLGKSIESGVVAAQLARR